MKAIMEMVQKLDSRFDEMKQVMQESKQDLKRYTNRITGSSVSDVWLIKIWNWKNGCVVSNHYVKIRAAAYERK